MTVEPTPPEDSVARETGIPATFKPWPNQVDGIDELASEVLREAAERIETPLDIAELELEDLLRNLLEAELSEKACGKALELVEMLRGVAGSRHNLVMDLSLRIVPALPGRDGDLRDFLEATLQDSLRSVGLDTTEKVDGFVKRTLGNVVGYVRGSLPEFPAADWYKHDWAVARLRERRAARLANEGS